MSEYKITEEMKDMFLEYVSAANCRDIAVKTCFFTKTAIKYGKIAEKKRLKFWEMLYDLYPNLKNKELQYNSNNMFVTDLINDGKEIMK
jgi:hypothetical protein